MTFTKFDPKAFLEKEKLTNIKVLDHGCVRLVDSMGSDQSVVRAARVSYDAAWRAGEDKGSDARLINYLWSHAHTSPFESVTFTLYVKAPIFVFRQWHRHRTWSFNEVSARYKEVEDQFYMPEKFRLQATDNKQGSSEEKISTFLNAKTSIAYRHAHKVAHDVYIQALNDGISRELARTVLPVATYSQMFATVNLLNLFKFLTLRCDKHAQYEIRVYADAMKELIRPIVPECVKAWEKANKGASK